MKLEDWVQRYELRAEKWNTGEGYHLFFDEEKGLLDYAIADDDGERAFIIGNCSTKDMAFFYRWCKKKAIEQECRVMYTSTMRNPAAYVRKAYSFGAKPHLDLKRSGYQKDGRFYWIFTERIDNETEKSNVSV